MRTFTTLVNLAGAVLLAGAIGGCLQAPDYSNVPSITFNRVDITRLRGSGLVPADSLKFFIDFKDGDGDLGLSEADRASPPYNQGDNRFNYLIRLFKKDPGTGRFEPFVSKPVGGPDGPLSEFDSTFPRLDGNSLKPGPLKGTLKFTQFLSLDRSQRDGSYAPGQIFRFEITIVDRALNKSNMVTTSEVTL